MIGIVEGQKMTKALAFLLVRGLLPTVTSCLRGVSLLLNALVAGSGSFILSPSMALT